MMSYKVEKITEPLVLGEAPHWDEKQQALYFVDVIGQTINKYVYATRTHTRTTVDAPVGFIIPVEGTTDQFLIGLQRQLLIVRWDGKEGTPATLVREVAELDEGTQNRVNDAKADHKGRVFVGTLGAEISPANFQKEQASIYRVDGKTISKLESKISIGNGLAWDLKEKAFYYIDSIENKIRRYDYNVETGDISNLKYIFDLSKTEVEGFPDGMTIDTDGNLWVAIFKGSAVIKVNPKTGQILQKVPIPALQITSVTFGGPNYDVLFVTTGSWLVDQPQLPPCGSTFAVTGLGVRGLPNVSYKP